MKVELSERELRVIVDALGTEQYDNARYGEPGENDKANAEIDVLADKLSALLLARKEKAHG